ncbi:tetratricopeptide repeat protein, partial [Xanthovirga aplysinae]|uniref:tetratricopeptide repeat protein n=1 Tax=Xanthovirga aplysinae TaxID=2529853 RepID=UPI0012BD092A
MKKNNALSKQCRFLDPDSALIYGKRAANLAERLNDQKELSRAFLNQGVVYALRGKNDEALLLYEKSLKKAQDINYVKGIENAFLALGGIQFEKGNWEKGLDYFFHSLEISDHEELTEFQKALILNYIGWLNVVRKNYKRAEDLFGLALNYEPDIRSEELKVKILSNLAYIQAIQKNNDLALDFIREAKELANQTNNRFGISEVFFNKGIVALNENKFGEASQYFRRSISQNESLDNINGLSIDYYYMAKLAFVQGEYPLALKYLDKSQYYTNITLSKVQMAENSVLYNKVYEALGNIKMAYKAQNQFLAFHDSLMSEESIAVAEIFLKDLQHKRVQKIIGIKNLEIQKDKTIIGLLFVVLLLLCLMGLGLFLRYKNNKKVTAKLHLKNDEILGLKNKIEAQNIILEKTNQDLERTVSLRTKNLQQVSKELELLIYRSSHDLKGPLTSIK